MEQKPVDSLVKGLKALVTLCVLGFIFAACHYGWLNLTWEGIVTGAGTLVGIVALFGFGSDKAKDKKE